MDFTNIRVDIAGPIAILALNRPKVLNAINLDMRAEIDHAINLFEQDDAIKAVVFTGTGERAFSAGADIHEMAASAEMTTEEREERSRRQAALVPWLLHLINCRKPTIGAINGLAFGAGADVAGSMDIRVGCERTSFRFLAATYGQVTSTWFLPILIGTPKAKELLITGREVPAQEALEIGLLNKVVSSERLMDETLELASLVAKNHPAAVQGIKKLLNQSVGTGFQERWEMEREAVRTWLKPMPVREGFKDFLARKGDAKLG